MLYKVTDDYSVFLYHPKYWEEHWAGVKLPKHVKVERVSMFVAKRLSKNYRVRLLRKFSYCPLSFSRPLAFDN